ncbi:MAG: 30S ribosomal protein S4 [Nanobdellota archaeon]
MGTPKRIRRKYETPNHPWIKSRIDDEKRLAKEFGTKNKREIWRMETVLKKFKSQAKYLIAATSDQVAVEKKHLFRRINELGLVQGEASFDKILGLKIDDVMNRRLQTVVYNKGLARSVKQARQFITHEHILVNGYKVTSPSYLVTVSEEAGIEFSTSSSLYSDEHPERAQPEKESTKKSSSKKKDSDSSTSKKSDDKAESSSSKEKSDNKSDAEKKDSDSDKKETSASEKNVKGATKDDDKESDSSNKKSSTKTDSKSDDSSDDKGEKK